MMIIILISLGWVRAVTAQPSNDPVAIVRQLYGPYVTDDSPNTDGLMAIADHATSQLRRLIQRDRACEAREQGICRIGFDPVIAGQDWQLNHKWPVFSVSEIPSGKKVAATFTESGRKMAVVYAFVRKGGKWLICDVSQSAAYTGGTWDLVRILSAKM